MASLICPASSAQATSSTFTEISLPMNPFSCAVCASLLVTIWNVSGPVSRLQSPFGGGSRLRRTDHLHCKGQSILPELNDTRALLRSRKKSDPLTASRLYLSFASTKG